VLPRQIISRSSKRPANYPLNFEGLKNGYESLRHRFGITRTGRIGRRSGCIKSRWRLSRNSLAGMIAIPRSHLLHKQFPVRSDRPFIVAAVLMQNTDKADLGWGCGMGHFHAEGDCPIDFRLGLQRLTVTSGALSVKSLLHPINRRVSAVVAGGSRD
jgi:hypothetical protein